MYLFSTSRISHVDVLPVCGAQNTGPGIRLEASFSHSAHTWPPTATTEHWTWVGGRWFVPNPSSCRNSSVRKSPQNIDALVEEKHTSTWHLDMAFIKDSRVPGHVTWSKESLQGYLGTALVCHTMVLWSLIQGPRSPMQQHLARMSLLLENDTKDNHVHYEKTRAKLQNKTYGYLKLSDQDVL